MKGIAFDINWLKQRALEAGHTLLTEEYRALQGKYLLKCSLEHQWEATGYSIVSKMKCPSCRYDIRLQSLLDKIQKMSIELLSKNYWKLCKKYQWKCSNNHIWEASANSVVKHGCPECKNKEKFNIIAQKVHERGFELISTTYKGIHAKYLLECPDKHRWEPIIKNFLSGSGCPHCKVNLTEYKCRFIFEQLTGFKFTKTQSMLSQRLELDGYCKELNLAFEYNGEQHYLKMKHISNKSYNGIKRRDKLKSNLCEQKGINLIIIPYVEKPNLENCIKDKLINLKINLYKINWTKYDPNPRKIQQIREILSIKNITCLSDCYEGNNTKLNLKCDICDHMWATDTNNIINNKTGCPKCNHTLMFTIEEVRDFCESKEIKFISDTYSGRRKKYEFECSIGHRWFTSFMSIKGNSKCPICLKNNHNLIHFNKIKTKTCEFNYTFLSDNFFGASKSYKFQCNKCKNIRCCAYRHFKKMPKCSTCYQNLTKS